MGIIINKNIFSLSRTVHGSGLINKIIDKLPFEAHIPGGYKFCGPGMFKNIFFYFKLFLNIK